MNLLDLVIQVNLVILLNLLILVNMLVNLVILMFSSEKWDQYGESGDGG